VTLNRLNEKAPQHTGVLKWLAKTYSRLADWDRLPELSPHIQRAGVLSEEKLLSLEIETWSGLIGNRAKMADIDSLTLLWNEIPGNIKT
jgi:uncharacterized protein HemY